MKVDSTYARFDANRQQQYYAGTHLAYYPNVLKERAIVINKFENGIFKRYLEKANGQRDLISTSTTREKQFLALRQEHRNREELLQQLNYKNGVHYSVSNALHFLL
ncbi:hypothetical protein CSE16_00320 [Solibacillus sp. R5-41]|uniref:hypothetical protein n=1 Tax=Solibacillus sp. R5-41 TaxID=2048654 RepID=UPI000C1285C7|nr:hypothetical protein [Solibacillus sp. R5-41]ATP38617.1 hypothetical protein CSE16_00320 [Solibacillus sp. R5-41]